MSNLISNQKNLNEDHNETNMVVNWLAKWRNGKIPSLGEDADPQELLEAASGI
jgi:hypothetical protein